MSRDLHLFGEDGRTNPYQVGAGAALGPADGGEAVVSRRHREWLSWRLHWQFLLDSYEGGQTYSQAVYGWDLHGYPVRNLVRHKYEYNTPLETYTNTTGFNGPPQELGADPSKYATDNDYELRRARTPVPTFFREAVETHLSKIYTKEITRKGPTALEAWWADVDGCGTDVARWMEQLIAPLGMTLANLDILFDHPAPPDGETVANRADADRLGLGGVVASVIMPENMIWWRLDNRGKHYIECLVREWNDDHLGFPVEYFRHWTCEQSVLYDVDGEMVGTPTPHPYGRPPIRRLFDQRRPRLRNVGQSRYEGIAFRQREYYNRDSESVLADTLQVHGLLQGPEDFVKEDGSLPIGPSWLLPKKKNTNGGAATYEGFEVVAYPTAGAESLRQNKQEIRDAVDRDAKLTKPAGAPGSTGQTVGQSGVSKKLDNQDGGQLLSRIKGVLEGWERDIAEMVLMVAADGAMPEDGEAVEITYPVAFDLQSIDELIAGSAGFQAFLETCGNVPVSEKLIGRRMIRELLPGQNDETYADAEEDLDDYIDRKAAAIEQRAEGMDAMLADRGIGDGGWDLGDDWDDEDEEPSGQQDPLGTYGGAISPIVSP